MFCDRYFKEINMAARKTNSRKKSSKAAGPKKSTGTRSRKKNTVQRASASSKRQAKKPVESAGIAGDVILLVALVSAILIFAFNFGVGGIVGGAVSDFLFGVFGLTAYVVPFYIFFAIAFYIANRNNSLIVRKTIGLILLLIFVCAIVQLVVEPNFSREAHISDYYYDKEGGGFIGGAIEHIFTLAFSPIVAWILTLAGLVLSLIVLTQKPLLSKLGIKTKRTALEVRKRRRESREQEDDLDDIDYDDEEDLASADAMLKSKKRRTFPIFNLLPFGSKSSDYDMDDELDEDDLEDEEELRRHERRRAEARKASSETDISVNITDGAETEDTNEFGKSSETVPSEKKNADSSSSAKTAKKGKGSKKSSGRKKPAYTDDSKMPAFLRTVMQNSAKKTEKDELSDVSSASESSDRALDAESEDINKGRKESKDAAVFEGIGIEEPDGSDTGSHIVIEGTGISDAETAAKRTDSENTAKEDKTPKKRGSVKKAKSREEEIVSGINTISDEISTNTAAKKTYVLPSTDLLTRGKVQPGDSRQHLIETAQKLEQIFRDFGVNVHVNNVSRGPTVTRYELTPEQGVKVSRIVALTDDIKLNLAASEIRIEAPIPGKAAVGIEVPNKESTVVAFRDLVESNEYIKSKAPLTFAVGKDIAGKPVISDIAKMPHLLIAGATGSGKSVCINTLIMSVLLKSTPDEVRMLMIDPKVVELKIYDGIPHLLIPVVTDPKKAAGALNWAVQEMNDRYNKFAEYTGVRDLKSYNKRVEKINEALPPEERLKKLPQILIIVDELADLMMVAPGEVEDAICRLAQLARAAGLHLVIATQRPSVNVVTGLIKANMPSRIALAVSSGVDSRTIIDMNGAEKLLGHGDMLFAPQGYPKPARVQGAYISDEDISRVVKYLSQQNREIEYNNEVESEITKTINNSSQTQTAKESGRDEYFLEAGRAVIDKDKATIGMFQRMFKIGFNRAARIMDQLCEAEVVGPEEGTKPRKVLMDSATFEAKFGGEE